jgi:hypothetical protein
MDWGFMRKVFADDEQGLFLKEPAIGEVELVPAELPKVTWSSDDHICVVVTFPCGCVNSIPVLSDGGLYPNSSVYTSCQEAWCAFGWDDAELHAKQFLEAIGKAKLVMGGLDDSE